MARRSTTSATTARTQEDGHHLNRRRGRWRVLHHGHEDRVHDQRCGQQMQPEGNVGAPRLALEVRGVEPHGQREDAEPHREEDGNGVIGHQAGATMRHSASSMAATAAAPAATVIGTWKRNQCSRAATAAAIRHQQRAGCGIIPPQRRQCADVEQPEDGDEDRAHENHQQHDAGQRQAPHAREEFGKPPGRRRNARRRNGKPQADSRYPSAPRNITRPMVTKMSLKPVTSLSFSSSGSASSGAGTPPAR